MPSKNPVQRFEDILENIAHIEEFTAGMTLESFSQNSQAIYAVKHALLIISEAAKKLNAEAEARCPEIPWPKVRAIGNLLRHEYDRIDVARIWFIVEKDLAPIKADVTRALVTLEGGML